jgi:membrane protease YdiL (CAAX protease family)
MSHLESSFSGKNHLWRYVVMIVVLLAASNTVGALPLIVAIAIKASSNPEVISGLTANPNDFGILNLDPNMGLFVMLFPFLAALIVYMLLIKPLNRRSFKVTVNGTDSIRWKRFFISGLVWLILSAIYLFIYLKADPSDFRLNNTSVTLIGLVIVSFLFIPFQATFEEVVFRGYLMQGFTVLAGNRWMPLLLTSLFFGVMHSFNPEVKEFGFMTMMPQYVLFGIIFGIITILDDGIEAAMGAHAANNIFLCIMVTNKASALETAAVYEQLNVYPWKEFLALLISGVIFIYILKVIFGWSSFAVLTSKVERPGRLAQTPYTEVRSSDL